MKHLKTSPVKYLVNTVRVVATQRDATSVMLTI